MSQKKEGSGFFSKLFGGNSSHNSSKSSHETTPITKEHDKTSTLRLSDDHTQHTHEKITTPMGNKILTSDSKTTSTKLLDSNTQRKKSLTRSPQTSDDEKNNQTLKDYNAKVASLQKYILQFQYVEETYELVEESFLKNSNQDKITTKRKMDDKMKHKCSVKYLKPILEWLGFPYLNTNIITDKKINEIYGKDINNKNEYITFKRVLVGTGELYFDLIEYKNNKNIKEFEIKDKNKLERFNKLSKGFNIVKDMFDCIDINKDGEITYKEFKSSFLTLVRNEDLVNSRMEELDYNHDGEITFREFIYGIGYWCGFNDEDDE